jgi:hypothetical protein
MANNEAAKLAERLRKWYDGGRKGMLTICSREDAPKAVKDAVNHWYDMGFKRLECIIQEIELLDEPND